MTITGDCSEPVISAGALLSCTAEIHALELGIVVGAFVAMTIVLRFNRLAMATVGGTVIATVGIVPVHPVVSMKPWYFAVPALAITWFAMFVRFWAGDRSRSIVPPCVIGSDWCRWVRPKSTRVIFLLGWAALLQLVVIPVVIGSINLIIFQGSAVQPMVDYWQAMAGVIRGFGG